MHGGDVVVGAEVGGLAAQARVTRAPIEPPGEVAPLRRRVL